MTPRLQDLDAKSQAKIRALVAQAPELSDRQRERLQLLFRGGARPPDAAGPVEDPGPTKALDNAENDSRTPTRQPADERGRR